MASFGQRLVHAITQNPRKNIASSLRATGCACSS